MVLNVYLLLGEILIPSRLAVLSSRPIGDANVQVLVGIVLEKLPIASVLYTALFHLPFSCDDINIS